ncbi:MAG: PIN domain-containing protein [Methyloversatilis sp.]|uniref:type II toxin-antitoxin system VapC family toxin n=1 Tax=Methyloversatilis sp. TaxID=2569862 RepID=UPI0027352993|nr:PIN domain-containing protein [Methyloversatilis sp.]MDP3872299.1 PIN domain-containing protein [Methyloversatilis sp.]
MIVFFDASALIYLVEGAEPFRGRVCDAIGSIMQQHPDAATALSRLSWLECRVGPMKANDAARLAMFDAFFARPDIIWVELSRDVVELAAEIRVRYGLRAADALQAASCLQLGPGHAMLTGDAAFSRVAGLNAVALA